MRLKLRHFASSCILKTQRAITRLGERIGSERLTYNFLAQYGFTRSARRCAGPFSIAIRKHFPTAQSIVDVGCGPGIFVARFSEDGLDAMGLEYSPRLRKKAKRLGVRVLPFDISKSSNHPFEKRFDIALSSEVAEHICEDLADAFVDYFDGLSEIVIFTAAQPGQGGTGHVNEQSPDYWRKKFRKIGLNYNDGLTKSFRSTLLDNGAFTYVTDNLSVFVSFNCRQQFSALPHQSHDGEKRA